MMFNPGDDQVIAEVLNGDANAFRVACVLVQKFDLPPDVALEEMRIWNQSCAVPPWPEKRLEYKISEAERLK